VIKYEVLEYIRPDGKCPFADWFKSLTANSAIKVVRALHKMRNGNFSTTKFLGDGVWEFKIDSGPGYRIYYGKVGKNIILLLTGGTKKRQNKDIELAVELLREYKKKHCIREKTMALTRDFRESIQARALKDPVFRVGLLEESINEFLAGDLYTAKALLRDYINASITFEALAKKTKISDKSLHRMFSDKGNPTTSNFCVVLQAIQQIEGVNIGAKIRH